MRRLLIFWLVSFCPYARGQQDTTRTETSIFDELAGANTGSAVTISRDRFNSGTVSHPLQLIVGRVPGLTITRAGGDPNGDYLVRLRALSTAQSTTMPLIVIDGFVGASLEALDPSDIASFTILKDASVASLFGARGANGVILVTTLSGKANHPSASYHTSAAVEKVTGLVNVMTPLEYRGLAGVSDQGASTHWMDEVTKRGYALVHNLSFSGGGDKTNYRVSVSYRKVEGIGLKSGFSKLNTRLHVTQKALGDRAVFTVQLANTVRDISFGRPQAFRYAITMNPTSPVYDASNQQYGGYFQESIFDYFNPVAIAEQSTNDGHRKLFLVGVHAKYDLQDLVPGASLFVRYARQTDVSLRGEYFARQAKFRGADRHGLATRSLEKEGNELLETGASFSKTISDLRLSASTVYSYQRFTSDGAGMSGGNFLTDAFGYNNMSAALDFENGLGSVWTSASSYKMIGFAANAGLSFRNAYWFNAAYTYSGSSRFGSNQKWAGYPTIGGAIQLTEIVSMRLFSSLKARMAWGVVGNIPVRSYASKERYGHVGTSYYNGAYFPTYQTIANANPELGPEVRREINFGADLTLGYTRISGSIDFFRNAVSDLISNVTVPSPPNLASTATANVGELESKGVEISLSYSAVESDDFTWTTGINIGKATTRVASLRNGAYSIGNDGTFYTGNTGGPGCGCSNTIRVKEGEKLGEFWGPVHLGLNADGSPRYKDMNGDSFFCDCGADMAVIGNAFPKLNLGIGNSLTYKNMTLDFFFRGMLGHDVINTYRLFYELNMPFGRNVVKTKYFDPALNRTRFSDYYIERASYLTLDNIVLGYRLPSRSLSSVHHVRFYLAAQNLVTFTGYSGMDPEARIAEAPLGYDGVSPFLSASPFSAGNEGLEVYPRTRTFTFGVSLDF